MKDQITNRLSRIEPRTLWSFVALAAFVGAVQSARASDVPVSRVWVGVDISCDDGVITAAYEPELSVQSRQSVQSSVPLFTDAASFSGKYQKFSYQIEADGEVTLFKPKSSPFGHEASIRIGKLDKSHLCDSVPKDLGSAAYVPAPVIASASLEVAQDISFTGKCTIRSRAPEPGQDYVRNFVRTLTFTDRASHAQVTLSMPSHEAFADEASCERAQFE